MTMQTQAQQAPQDRKPSAHKRAGVKWDDEYVIYNATATGASYEHVPSTDAHHGLEFCTVDGVQYWRYDCFASFSPFGWSRCDDTQFVRADTIKQINAYRQRFVIISPR